MKIQPRNEYVIVRPQERREKSQIVIPGQENEQDLFVVVAVGPGGFTTDGARAPIEITAGTPLRPGDVVFLRAGEYPTFTDNSVTYGIVPQSSILGVEVAESTLN